MFKFLTKPKFLKVIAMVLTLVFVVNIAGCTSDEGGYNGVKDNRENKQVGKGVNIQGYTVYGASEVSKMTKEIFMGYLLNGRDFSLVVVPGHSVGEDDEKTYEIDNNNNYLYQSALSGVLEYDEATARFVNPDKKFLLYYVTDDELNDWFGEFAGADTFINQAMSFASSKVNLNDVRRYTCKKLVNLGSGLNSDDFCDAVLKNKTVVGTGGLKTYVDGGVFTDSLTGGMIVLFSYSAIEGYITYEDIYSLRKSAVANTLTDSCSVDKYGVVSCDNYAPNLLRAHDVASYLKNEKYVDELLKNEYAEDDLKLSNIGLVNELVGIHGETRLRNASPGYDRLKTTYELLGQSLLLDYSFLYQKNETPTLETLRLKIVSAEQKETNLDAKDLYNQALSILDTMFFKNGLYKPHDKLLEAAEIEAFNIKMSVALQSRYTDIIEYPDTSNLLTGKLYGSAAFKGNGGYTGNLSYEKAKSLMNGEGSPDTDNSYLLLVTADGFVLDRGTEEDQKALGFDDAFGTGQMLAELVRMDGCPNETMALKMYNMLTNLKIVLGTALAATGLAVAVGAAVAAGAMYAVNAAATSTIAVIICKIAGVNAAAPYPGARIVSAVLIAVAALVVAAVGVYTLIKGIEEKNRIKGMGASKENYCQTYASTFNFLFENFDLTIPVYHYKVPKETDMSLNKGLALNYCEQGYDYNESFMDCRKYDSNNKVYIKEPISIPLYYYADLNQSYELDLEGAPMLLFFNKGSMVDYIVGASTPDFIVEMLRLWGLLAMREIVYQAEIIDATEGNDNSRINLYHTTNKSARTHTIQTARQCITADYNKNLFSNNLPESFCYYVDDSGNFNNGYHEIYVNKEYWNKGNNVLNVASMNFNNVAKTALSEKILSLSAYTKFFENRDSYKFYEEKNKYDASKMVDIIRENAEFDEQNKTITLYTSQKTVTYYAMYQDENVKYYLVKDDATEIVTVYVRENEANETYAVATMKGNITEFYIEKNDSIAGKLGDIVESIYVNGKTYTVKQNNVYLGGLKVGTIDRDNGTVVIANTEYTNVSITSYKPLTIGGNVYALIDGIIYDKRGSEPLVIGYYDNVNNKVVINNIEYKVNEDGNVIRIYGTLDFIKYVIGAFAFDDCEQEVEIPIYYTATIREYSQSNSGCDDGEYKYERKCLADDDVKSDDKPVKSDEEKYYSTNLEIGVIIITLDNNGQSVVQIKWYEGGN